MTSILDNPFFGPDGQPIPAPLTYKHYMNPSSTTSPSRDGVYSKSACATSPCCEPAELPKLSKMTIWNEARATLERERDASRMAALDACGQGGNPIEEYRAQVFEILAISCRLKVIELKIQK